MEKILITGTGRCGTTFLVKLFSFLGYDTGFNEHNYHEFIQKNCNAGMEKDITSTNYIIKNPGFLKHIEKIIIEKEIIVKTVIIPIRKYKASAESRAAESRLFNQNTCIPGGLWDATNLEEQLLFYHQIMSNYLYIMTKHDINTIFIDFDRMILDKSYLFETLKPILDEKNITIEFFSEKYDKATSSSKPRPRP